MSLYSQLLRHVILPTHGFLRRRRYLDRLSFLERSQWWPSGELRAFQWHELQTVLDVAFRSVPYYREKYRKAGIAREDVRTWEDYARLPILAREEVNEHKDALCSTEFRGDLLPHSTGGSSGQPARFFITYDSYDWRTAAKDRAYSWSGLQIGERSAYLWGAPVGKVTAAQLFKKRLHEAIDRQLVVNTLSQSEELWRDTYARIVRFRPKVIVGYVSSLEGFAEYLSRTGSKLPGVRAIIAAAEPLYAAARERLMRGLGAPVYNTYGSREFMSLGAECEQHDGLHIHAENVVVETLCGPSEGPSEVIVTDLHNFGMPFIRYALGDLGLLCDSTPCDCGRGLPRIRSIEGRVLDSMKTSDGRLVPGEFFPHVLKELPEIRHYQVQQKRADYIVISAVISEPLSEVSRGLLNREIAKVFGPKVKWELQAVTSIPQLASGKRRVTIGLG